MAQRGVAALFVALSDACGVIHVEPKRSVLILLRMRARASGSVGVGWFADEQAFAVLAARPEFLGGLLAHVQDGLSVANPRGKCVVVNRCLCEMTGFSAAELLAMPPHRY
jgi:PAS domain-containing protein